MNPTMPQSGRGRAKTYGVATAPKSCVPASVLQEIRRRAKSTESKTELVDSIFTTLVEHRVDPDRVGGDEWKQIVAAAVGAARSHLAAPS